MASAWDAIISRVESILREADSKGKSIWFRGQNRDYPLLSRIHRWVQLTASAAGSKPQGHLRSHERNLYLQYKRRAWPLLSEGARGEWSLLVTMQHHGIPTRLLDWTESFSCALFFALEGTAAHSPISGKYPHSPVIWLLDCDQLNSRPAKPGVVHLQEPLEPSSISTVYHPLTSFSGAPPELPLAVAAPFSTARMIAQHATFILTGDSFSPLDELAERGCLHKIGLPPESWEGGRSFLRMAGCDQYSLFPDLDGLARQFEDEQAGLVESLKTDGMRRQGK